MADTFLIVGGAGTIGSHMVHYLLSLGYQVVVVDDLSTGQFARFPSDVIFYESDFASPQTLAQVMRAHSIHTVMHFAASISPADSLKNPQAYYENNTCKGIRMLETLLKHGLKHCIFSSTAAVYAQQDVSNLSEDAPVAPITPYGRSKLMFEWILQDYARAHGLKAVSLRYFNVAGREPLYLEERPSFAVRGELMGSIARVVSGEESIMKIHGDGYPTPDGTCIRDFIHVMDVCDAHLAVYQYLCDGGASTVFNIGSGAGYSVKEVIEVARSVSGHPIPAEVVAARPGDLPKVVAAIGRIQDACGWRPKRSSLEDMIQSMWLR